MLREVLDACLKPEQKEAGFYMEAEEDFLYLKRGDKVLATWNARVATIVSIRDEAGKIMREGGE